MYQVTIATDNTRESFLRKNIVAVSFFSILYVLYTHILNTNFSII